MIIMLTTLLEKGRQKCHQYWPDQNESVEFGQLIITNLDEREERYAHYRELSIRNKMVRLNSCLFPNSLCLDTRRAPSHANSICSLAGPWRAGEPQAFY